MKIETTKTYYIDYSATNDSYAVSVAVPIPGFPDAAKFVASFETQAEAEGFIHTGQRSFGYMMSRQAPHFGLY